MTRARAERGGLEAIRVHTAELGAACLNCLPLRPG